MFLYLFKLADLLIIIASWVAAISIVEVSDSGQEISVLSLCLALVVYTVVGHSAALYRPWRGRRLIAELTIAAAVATFAFYAVGIVEYLARGLDSEPNLQGLVVWNLMSVTGLMSIRLFLRSLFRIARARGWNQRRILLVGLSSSTREVVDNVSQHPEYGLSFVGYADDRAVPREHEVPGLEYVGTMQDVLESIEQYDVTQVWITLPMKAEARASQLIKRLQFHTVSIRYVMDFPVFASSRHSLTLLGEIPLIDVSVSPMDGAVSRLVKDLEDKLVASIALLLLSPLMLLIAIGVKLSSPGPILFRQTRISWNNEPFQILKFRSMPIDVEKDSGPKWAKAGEKRAIPFGSFLRKTSLDELPQLINVLKGEMSIVGPRPERPEFVDQFKHEIPAYMKKHQVKAGMTGWAQVNGFRGDTDLKKRIEYDVYYIRNWTPLFDLQIGLQTVVNGFVNKNAY